MDTANWINLGIGIFASVIAVIALIWNIIRDKPKIKLRVELSGFPGMTDIDIETIVMNIGKSRIHIYEVGFILSIDQYKGYGSGYFGLPKVLNPGEQWSFNKSVNELIVNTPEARVDYVLVRDGTDRQYKRKVPNYYE